MRGRIWGLSRCCFMFEEVKLCDQIDLGGRSPWCELTLTSGQWHLWTPSLAQHGIFPSMDAFCPDLLYWVRLPHFLKQRSLDGRQKPLTRNLGAQSMTCGINLANKKCKVWNLVRSDLQVSECWGWVPCKASNAFVTQQMPWRQLEGDCSRVKPPGSTHPGHAPHYADNPTAFGRQ